MKIFITAINGFLGQSLAAYLEKSGHQISGSARAPSDTPPWPTVQFCLGQHDLDKEVFTGVDVVIHCAHDFSKDIDLSKKANIEGTQSLFEVIEKAGVKKQVFISSYSSHPQALSLYGQVKFDLEQFFLERHQIIVRPGLVIGAGGMCLNNIKRILKAPILPLLDHGQDPIPYISVDNFCEAIAVIINSKDNGAYNLFHKQMTTLKHFIESVNRAGNHYALHPSIPSQPIITMLEFASKLHLPLPSVLESIKGLKKNQDQLHQSDLHDLIPQVTSLEHSLQALVPNVS